MNIMVKTNSNRTWVSPFLDSPQEEDVRIIYRQPHDAELFRPGPKAASPNRDYRLDGSVGSARVTVKTIPEPFRLLPDHQTLLDCSWQALIRALNPEHKDDVVDKVLDHHWILANYTGIGEEDRKNCRNGYKMTDPNAKWPALHTPIICGGTLLSGVDLGDTLYIESLLTDQPVPYWRDVLDKPWLWFWLIQVAPTGNLTYMTLSAKDGIHRRVRMPLISRHPLYGLTSWFHRLSANFDLSTYDPRQKY